jgi:hypothetical protein
MKAIIRIAVIGLLCTVTPAALAGPPARNAARYPSAVACTKGCTTDVTNQLTRAKVYGTEVPKCHPETSGAVRWGKSQPTCAPSTF